MNKTIGLCLFAFAFAFATTCLPLVSSHAQNATASTAPALQHKAKRSPGVSAPARDVGPSSTITAVSIDDPRGGSNSGLPRVAGAPTAGSTGLGGH